jgi:hypothetical protein
MLVRTLAFVIFVSAAAAPGPAAAAPQFARASVADGLKEALRVGAGNAVRSTGRVDGFFRNAAIKILMPKQLRPLERGLRAVGQGALVDEFVLGMNRAAEKAAPFARDIFLDAISEMTFDDAVRILRGGDTAATDYFREKTSERLADAFRPAVEDATERVGVTRQYKDLVGRYGAFGLRGEAVDLDGYVVEKALDGIFHVLGEEERKIRRDPAARVTAILREVFR